MKKLCERIIGAGFIGTVHIEQLRRPGNTEDLNVQNWNPGRLVWEGYR
jgi:hypothetical protein